MRTEDHLYTVIRYVHRNPVTEGLVADLEDYEFSSGHPDATTDLDTFFGSSPSAEAAGRRASDTGNL
jgi:hypothetical protein